MTSRAADGVSRLTATLDAIGAAGSKISLWWRDDDLETCSPELDALLGALAEQGIAPALAAVAGTMDRAVLPALEASPARLFVHGWLHADHSAPGAKKSEFGVERPIEARLAEIVEGRRRLSALAGERLIPCFVPPWNRLGDDLLERLGGTGVIALSGFAPKGRASPPADVPRLDTHVDLIDWRAGRTPLPVDAVALTLEARILHKAAIPENRHDSPVDGPVGILSHHRVTDMAAWRAWRPLLALLAGHPAVRWLDPAAALASVMETPAGDAGGIRRIG